MCEPVVSLRTVRLLLRLARFISRFWNGRVDRLATMFLLVAWLTGCWFSFIWEISSFSFLEERKTNKQNDRAAFSTWFYLMIDSFSSSLSFSCSWRSWNSSTIFERKWKSVRSSETLKRCDILSSTFLFRARRSRNHRADFPILISEEEKKFCWTNEIRRRFSCRNETVCSMVDFCSSMISLKERHSSWCSRKKITRFDWSTAREQRTCR